ncbi:MAG: alpha/beta fold hydrolase [Rhizobacter sp.]|nr:alpha/beta fold hydrolase [Ferruginibacter sp.]
MQKITITARDGYPLSALYAIPIAESKGTVVVSSATSIKKEFYINFTTFLVQHGYRVLLYDYRGVGESAPGDLKTSLSYMHEWGTMDMNAALNYLVIEKRLTNIIWMGHSIGAQLAGCLDNRHHVKKVISISAALGYWGYFPFPMNVKVWSLWYIISPLLIKIYGYGTLKRLGWGEDLPKNIILEWRKWCMSKNYYQDFLEGHYQTDKFYNFTTPIEALYMSDDYIANDKTAPLMKNFFPNAPYKISRISTKKYTDQKVGHIGIFRKKFKNSLWPLLIHSIEK